MSNKRTGTNRNLGSWCWLCAAFSFMFCIFGPLETFMTNQSEFWFSFGHLVPVLLVMFVIAFAVLLLITVPFQRLKKSYLVFIILFCFFLFFYIQGNYIPRNYGVLDGGEIQWDSYRAYGIASIILAVVIAVLGVGAAVIGKEKFFTIGKMISIGILLVQIITLGTVYLQGNILSKPGKADNLIVSREGIFELSDKKNIIIFIMDTLDTEYMQATLAGEDGEKYKEILADFTYYPDTLGCFPYTKAALPQILTGEAYRNDMTYSDYKDKAYAEDAIYSTLLEKGYDIGVYTNSLYMNSTCESFINVIPGVYSLNNPAKFGEKWLKLVAYNYFPHQFKKYFYATASDFDKFKKNTYIPYTVDVQEFDKGIETESIVMDEKKCLRIYHLDGVHDPHTFDKNLSSTTKEAYTPYDETQGCLKLMDDYIKKLKEAGIYDQSTIIVMADHGELNWRQNPLWMIKNVDEHHEFAVSDVEVSYEYLKDIYQSLANEEVIDEEYMRECMNNCDKRRYLYYLTNTQLWTSDYMTNMIEFYTEGNAMDPDNLRVTGNVYRTDGLNPEYKYGTKLDFSKDELVNLYGINGLEHGDSNDGVWTTLNDVLMQFKCDATDHDLELTMKYSTVYRDKQHILLYVNNELIADYDATQGEEKQFTIPNEVVADGNIVVWMMLPDAISPAELGNSQDVRTLGIVLQEISISEK